MRPLLLVALSGSDVMADSSERQDEALEESKTRNSPPGTKRLKLTLCVLFSFVLGNSVGSFLLSHLSPVLFSSSERVFSNWLRVRLLRVSVSSEVDGDLPVASSFSVYRFLLEPSGEGPSVASVPLPSSVLGVRSDRGRSA